MYGTRAFEFRLQRRPMNYGIYCNNPLGKANHNTTIHAF